tara:strand:+ start:31 stop:1356 length:1326 start_codon:yes stop_codon:yes gene_type:complete
MSFDLILIDGQVMTGSNNIPTLMDIGIKDGKIISIGNLKKELSLKVVNCSNLVILPGVIDTQVHFRDPGLTHKEDIESGSKSAVLGGITAFCEMPNTKPLTVSEFELRKKIEKSEKVSWCDYSFFVGATSKNISNLNVYEKLTGCAGVKIFMGSSTGELLVHDYEMLLKIMENGSRRVAVHAEDEERLKDRFKFYKKYNDARYHPTWRDPKSALLATKKIMDIANKANRPLHILHISSANEMKLLQKKSRLISVEVTPQHLTLNSPECYNKLGTYAQMNPPIRSKYHQDELWKGIENGTVDVIGSDHAPHTIEEKQIEYPNSPSGMPGTQTMLPLMLNEVSKNKIKLSKLVSLLCTRPAEIYKMKNRGKIEEGYLASLTVIDLNLVKSLKKSDIKSRCAWSPFTDKLLKGWPVMTIINGDIAMQNQTLTKKPKVQKIIFEN